MVKSMTSQAIICYRCEGSGYIMHRWFDKDSLASLTMWVNMFAGLHFYVIACPKCKGQKYLQLEIDFLEKA